MKTNVILTKERFFLTKECILEDVSERDINARSTITKKNNVILDIIFFRSRSDEICALEILWIQIANYKISQKTHNTKSSP